ncbi:MAG: hypothetical protein ACXVB9_18695 [Bdellovibrionota bacterium]
MKIRYFLVCLVTLAGCSSNPLIAQRDLASTQPEVSGAKAVAVYKGFEYVFDDFDSGGSQQRIDVVVTNVACPPGGECTADFKGQSSHVGGTMVGYKQIFEFLGQCESHAASKVACGGSVNQFGAPDPSDFKCTAACK